MVRVDIPISQVVKVKYTFLFQAVGNLEGELGLDANILKLIKWKEYIKMHTYKFDRNAMHPESSSDIQIYVSYTKCM